MKRLLIILTVMLSASSCGVMTLYDWGGNQNGTTLYESLAYKSYDIQTPQNVCDMIFMYDKVINNPGGQRQLPPPGICAEYGYLLLKPETAQIFAEHAKPRHRAIFEGDDYTAIFGELGMKMLEKEIQLYPESTAFLTPLIKKYQNM